MYSYEQLKIYLCDIDRDMVNAWKMALEDSSGVHENIELFEGSFHNFMCNHPEVDGIVSPANSYGLMDGGYDGAITAWFGEDVMAAVQSAIIEEYFGEQPVGSCLVVQVPPRISFGQFILHTPTMRVPSIIEDPEIVYHCTRACIIAALKNEFDTIVIPAFGACTGRVEHEVVARYMERAFCSFEDVPKQLDWAYARVDSPLGQRDPKRGNI